MFSDLRLSKTLIAPALMLAAIFAPVAIAAPDEAAYGADRGYPKAERGRYIARHELVGTLSAFDEVYSARKIRAGGKVRPLPLHPSTPDWPFIDDYLASHPATGLLVIHDSKVLLERYQYGRTAQMRLTSFSMAKSIVGMAVGIAVAEGKIASLDDPVDRYEPALAGTAWKGIPIRQVLTMSSGVRFDEGYDKPDSDIARLSRNYVAPGRGTFLETLATFQDHDAKPGERFKYISADTQVLGHVLTKATGQKLADYVSEKIWVPMGAEADASWLIDGSGMEAAYCCVQARLRDFGRLGLLMLEGGQYEGRSVIPKAWVEAGTTVAAKDGHLQPRRATPYMGYGYQTWVLPDDLGFSLRGLRGQAVYVHPRLKLVMVQTSVWHPPTGTPEYGRQRENLWRELVKRAGQW